MRTKPTVSKQDIKCAINAWKASGERVGAVLVDLERRAIWVLGNEHVPQSAGDKHDEIRRLIGGGQT